MKDFFEKLRPEFAFNKYSLINSLKATFACLLGLYLVYLLHLEQAQWVLITTLIVMAAQYRLGAAMIKGYARLFASAVGSAIAAIILYLFSSNIVLVYCLLFFFITIYIYLASNSKEYSYSYSLGAVTMVVIVVSTHPQLNLAFERLVEIMLGVIIALLVSRFIFPIHAEKLFYKNIAETIRLLKKAYRLFIREEKLFSYETKGKDIEEDIIQHFSDQPVLLKEACAENKKIRKNTSKYRSFLRLERRLLRSIYMLHLTLRLSLKSFSDIIKMQEFTRIHNEIIEVLEEIAKKVEDRNYVFTERNLEVKYEEVILKLRSMFNQYSFEEKNKIHTFIFCLGHILVVLKRMKRVLNEMH